MELNDILTRCQIGPRETIVFRHRPNEPRLSRALPMLAAERHDVFNGYQQTQSRRVEAAMRGASYVASFIADGPGRALFVGIYKISSYVERPRNEYWSLPHYAELRQLGMRGFAEEEDRDSFFHFQLDPTAHYANWKGKLVIGWSRPERQWWRRAHTNQFPLIAILEESRLDPPMPSWSEIDIGYDELRYLPPRWRSALAHWRGIYFIFDELDGKGYVGSAYGDGNILSRWLTYATTGHGGNMLMRGRNPASFRFSILERVSPDMPADEVVRLETSWKKRLHTRMPSGLNDN